jgi:biotin-dependent carboxylase-like uncharacterized protein
MIRVMSIPPLATVQDLGRDSHWFEGLGRAGAMDPVSHRIANMLLGNAASAATLEIPLTPAQFRFDTRQAFAIAGAVCGARLDGRPLPRLFAGLAKAGDVLELGPIRAGARLYLALPGGIDVPEVLGSRSTQLREAFGGYKGRVLAPGDVFKPMTQSDPALSPSGISLELSEFRLPNDGTIQLRALPSTEHDSFDAASLTAFWSEPYRVTRQNDRQGHRLDGPVLKRHSSGELRSHGIVPGIVQVPGGGLPIFQLADSATMGGYPKIAAIIEPDLWRMGQARPGERVLFRKVGLAEAAQAADDHEAALAKAGQALAKAFEQQASWA